MKATLASAVAGLSLLGLAWGGTPASAQESAKDIYEAAKKEGKVVYWGSPSMEVFAKIGAAFTKRYPGVELEMFRLQPAAAVERIVTAASAGRFDADCLDTPVGYLPLLFNRGLASATDWHKTFGTDPGRVLFDGKAVVIWDIDMPIAFNTNLVKPEEIKTWDDLANPKWRGRLAMDARGLAFAALAIKAGEDKAFGLLQKLVANTPLITKGGTATREDLAGGQAAVAVGIYGGLVEQYRQTGAPIDWAKVGPIPAMMEAMAPLKGGPHPNATKLWINFMTSPEAQELLYQGLGLGMVHGSSLSPLGKEYSARKLEISLESTDTQLMQRLVSRASGLIGALK